MSGHAHSHPAHPAEISIEYFPPRGLSCERALVTGAHALRRFKPDYQTVTFGAGGSAVEGSLEWSSRLEAFTEIPTASHVAICHFSRATLIDFAEELWDRGITRLVVLRGDVAAGEGDGLSGFRSVADAIGLLKSLHPFDVSVAAYPEVHPKARSADDDLAVLLEKQEAGANRAITQFFFNNEDFYRFRDQAVAKGFGQPIVPGIIPIANFERIQQFAHKCGASVPAEFVARFAQAGDDRAEQTRIARSILEEQVRDLAANGIASLHIYSLNRVDLTADAIRAFRAEFPEQSEPEYLTARAG